jgi:hypothetical protein
VTATVGITMAPLFTGQIPIPAPPAAALGGPTTGPIRIDALTGHAPTWRPDALDAPIYDQLVSELGPPGMLAGPGQLLPADTAELLRAYLDEVDVVVDAITDDETEAALVEVLAVAPDATGGSE